MKKQLHFVLHVVFLLLLNNDLFAQACPNGDFENYVVKPYNDLDSGWITSNQQSLSKDDTLTVWKVAGQSGQAVHIQTAIIGTDTLMAYIENTQGDPTKGQGGVPYSQKPTAITGYYRYSLLGNDSATIIVLFKKAGSVISQNLITFRGTGNQSTFAAFSFPLSSLSTTPDSVIVAAASSNVFGSGLRSGSWLELDQLAFTGPGVTQNIPGGSFDSWTSNSLDQLIGWSAQGSNNANIARSTTHYAGNYSIKLTSGTPGSNGGSGGNGSPAQISTGLMGNNGPHGGEPYTRNIDTLTGYYMYTPVGHDTAGVNITLTHLGTVVGGNYQQLMAASTWTAFQIPFNGSSPDTIRIDIQSGSWWSTTGGSVLYMDYLQLRSQPLPPASIVIVNNGHVLAYPNPATDVLNIKLDNTWQGPLTLKVYDMTGRSITNQHYGSTPSLISVPVSQLPAGLYFYEVNNNGMVIRDKFIKD